MNIYDAIGVMGISMLFLAAGIGIGIAIRSARVRGALSLIAQATTHCAAQLVETVALSKEARGLSDACVKHQPQLPGHIVAGADSVVQASASLQRQMESLNNLMVVFQQSRNNAGRVPRPAKKPSASPGRSDDELHLFQDRGAKPGGTKPPRKLSFDLWQYVATFDGAEYPPPNSFELVHCTGSSSEGFSYFSKRPPLTEKLIVAVGSPSDLQFFLADALHTRSATMDGEQGHLTTCLFEQKLAGIYQWDTVQCRIALNSSLVPA